MVVSRRATRLSLSPWRNSAKTRLGGGLCGERHESCIGGSACGSAKSHLSALLLCHVDPSCLVHQREHEDTVCEEDHEGHDTQSAETGQLSQRSEEGRAGDASELAGDIVETEELPW
jgi:hypothetical protein